MTKVVVEFFDDNDSRQVIYTYHGLKIALPEMTSH
jgi:hypothetical protein